MSKKDSGGQVKNVDLPPEDAEIVELFPVPRELRGKPAGRDKDTVVRAKKHLYYFPDKAINSFVRHNKDKVIDICDSPATRAAMKYLLMALFELGGIEIVARKNIRMDEKKTIKHCRPKKLLLSLRDDVSPVPEADIVHHVVLPRNNRGDRFIPLGHGMALELPLSRNTAASLEKLAAKLKRHTTYGPPESRRAWGKMGEAVTWLATIIWQSTRTESAHRPAFDELTEHLDDVELGITDLAKPNRLAAQVREVLEDPPGRRVRRPGPLDEDAGRGHNAGRPRPRGRYHFRSLARAAFR